MIGIAFRKALIDKKASGLKKTVTVLVLINMTIICLSTLLIKQHYILDGITAVLLCELA
jgi:hypothetical protein